MTKPLTAEQKWRRLRKWLGVEAMNARWGQTVARNSRVFADERRCAIRANQLEAVMLEMTRLSRLSQGRRRRRG